jgi:pyridoxine 4-dehydrogenase
VHTGKYSLSELPPGPRGNLFRQLLPGIQPLLTTLEAVANSRRKTMSQVATHIVCGTGLLQGGGVPLGLAGRLVGVLKFTGEK